jgi:hypothetical protein
MHVPHLGDEQVFALHDMIQNIVERGGRRSYGGRVLSGRRGRWRRGCWGWGWIGYRLTRGNSSILRKNLGDAT